jgi:stearoyl-CoA desaturase (delta-9 desaturase)
MPQTGVPQAPASGASVPRFRLHNVRWNHFLAILALHLLCFLAPFTFSWGALLVAFLLNWFVLSLGVSMGYHRLLTHRAFETPRFFRYFLAAVGTLAWQGGPIFWVGTHRVHHSESDTEMDPHSPHHGFTWGHVLWCLVRDPFGRDVRSAAKDLQKDRVMVWIDRFFYVPQILLAVILWLAGGWSWVVWGIAVRTVVSYHSTWFVNSASHLWGYRNFETKEESRNNWWVALISWGEGWHNNHHAFQRSATFGLRWFELDLTYLTIKALSLVGLARNIQVPAVDWGSSRGAAG